VKQMSIAARILDSAVSNLTASALLVLLLFSQLAHSAAIRIMPLGDSITRGSVSGVIPDDPRYYVSYRKALRDILVSAGYEIDYVGSELSGDAVFDDDSTRGTAGGTPQVYPVPAFFRRYIIFCYRTPKTYRRANRISFYCTSEPTIWHWPGPCIHRCRDREHSE